MSSGATSSVGSSSGKFLLFDSIPQTSLAVILDSAMVDTSELSASTRGDARRSQRVILRVAILVRAEMEGEPPLTEDTFTLVVNAHGALIALAMKVRPGQKLILRNWATAKEKQCRVIHVKENPFGKNEVGIEFPFPDAHFWNLDFPPPDWKPFLK